jgi:RNA polymerase sigma-70 factor (ECF subfamily)
MNSLTMPRDDGLAQAQEPVRSGAETLVARAQRGDLGAFETLYRENAGRVYSVCLRMLADPVRAEEATQDAFVRAWQSLSRFEERSSFPTWLHRITVNIVLDRKRAEKRRGPMEDVDDREIAERARVSPERTIDLERAIAGLPPGARTAFVLHDIEGYRHREIAEMTGTAEGTWKSQLHRARRLLREAMQR